MRQQANIYTLGGISYPYFSHIIRADLRFRKFRPKALPLRTVEMLTRRPSLLSLGCPSGPSCGLSPGRLSFPGQDVVH